MGHTIGAGIAAPELLLVALSDGDAATIVGPIVRAATLVADLQPPANRYTDANTAIRYLHDADDIAKATRDLLTSPATSPAVHKLVARILTAADRVVAGWSK